MKKSLFQNYLRNSHLSSLNDQKILLDFREAEKFVDKIFLFLHRYICLWHFCFLYLLPTSSFLLTSLNKHIDMATSVLELEGDENMFYSTQFTSLWPFELFFCSCYIVHSLAGFYNQPPFFFSFLLKGSFVQTTCILDVVLLFIPYISTLNRGPVSVWPRCWWDIKPAFIYQLSSVKLAYLIMLLFCTVYILNWRETWLFPDFSKVYLII